MVCGLLLAAGVIAALHLPLVKRRALLEGQLKEKQGELDRLNVVRVQVDAYQRDHTRLDRQVEWIEQERSKRKCLWPLPGLDLEGVPGVRIDGIVVEGSTLVLSGKATPTALEGLARAVRAAAWAREVEAGTASPEVSSFGLFARVQLPSCGSGEAPAATGMAP
jgi:hypothetical protein